MSQFFLLAVGGLAFGVMVCGITGIILTIAMPIRSVTRWTIQLFLLVSSTVGGMVAIITILLALMK